MAIWDYTMLYFARHAIAPFGLPLIVTSAPLKKWGICYYISYCQKKTISLYNIQYLLLYFFKFIFHAHH